MQNNITTTIIKELIGKTFVKVEVNTNKYDNDSLVFHDLLVPFGGGVYVFSHWQDCCESVYIEDVCGDLSDLENSPILLAEEIIHDPGPGEDEGGYGENLWTFYKFSTIKGTVVVRFVGSSNGYYSMTVSHGWEK